MKIKSFLLSIISGIFLGSICLGNSCIAMMEEDSPLSKYGPVFSPVHQSLYTVIPGSTIPPKPPASEVKQRVKRRSQIDKFLEKHGGLDNSILEAKQVSPEFYDFARISGKGFADRINQDHKTKGCYNQKCRCSNCGWIGFPRRNDGRSYFCRGCQCGGGVGNGLLLQIFNGNRTTRFGLCPNSTAETPHFGFIHDMRIVRSDKEQPRYEGLKLNELKRDTRATHCCFYCYDCGKNVAVPLDTISPDETDTSTIDLSIIDARMQSPQFDNFIRISRNGFEDRINQYYKTTGCYNQKCRCSNCGWIGFPRNNGVGYFCRGCQCGGGVGNGLLFQIFNGNRTIRFGICPNSTAGNPHFGFIHDMRIVQRNSSQPHHYEGLKLAELKGDKKNKTLLVLLL